MFKNRRQAGKLLATSLAQYQSRTDVIVFGLARGGVPVAYEVAKALHAPLDVIVVRKVGVPGQEELAMGAIAPEGLSVTNPSVINTLELSEGDLKAALKKERKELVRREQLYRGSKSYPDLKGKITILVDDGLATGATMRAALSWARSHKPATIVVAAPVASRSTCDQIKREKDHLLCICNITPEDFWAVGLWYEDFSQVSDEEVMQFLSLAEEERGKSSEAFPHAV